MKYLLALLCIVAFVTGCATTTTVASTQCTGVERWSVKTGTDTLADEVNLTDVHDTTIKSLTSEAVPAGFSQDAGRLPEEMTVYRLHATLVEYKLESDRDYHLVIRNDSGDTMIVEIPDPNCVHGSSPFLPGITNARSEFDKQYTVTNQWQQANVPVIVTGVSFFDTLHHQTGVAPNGRELHPLTDIQFATATPSSSATGMP